MLRGRISPDGRYRVRVWSPQGMYWTETIEAGTALEAVVKARQQLVEAPELRHMVGWQLSAVPEDWYLAGQAAKEAGR